MSTVGWLGSVAGIRVPGTYLLTMQDPSTRLFKRSGVEDIHSPVEVVPVDLFGQQCRGQIAWPVRCFGVWAHVSLEGWVAGGILQRGRPFRHVAAAVPVREADGPVEQPALRQQRRIARAGGITGARVAAPEVRYLGETVSLMIVQLTDAS